MAQSPALTISQINESAFVIVTWIFCAFALLTWVIRVSIRVHARRAFQADDYLLLLAAACLLAAKIFTQTRHENIYLAAKLSMNPDPTELQEYLPHLYDIAHQQIIYIWVFSTLIWTTIYAAKFAYLTFFKTLVRQIKPLTIFWWVITVLAVISYIASIVQAFAVCPWADLRAVECSYGSRFAKTIKFAEAAMALDVIVDVLIASLAITILLKLKIRNVQKAGLAVFLCLSIILAVVAIVRIARLRRQSVFGTVVSDGPWSYFWLQIEGSLAVALVSLTAFRSFFIMRERKRQEAQEKRDWRGSALRFLHRGRKNDTNDHGRLPPIPGATMTGLQSFLQRNSFRDSHSDTIAGDSASDNDVKFPNPTQIIVTRTFQTEVQPAMIRDSHHPFNAMDSTFRPPSSNTMLPAYRSQGSNALPSYNTSKCERSNQGDSR